ncbi:sel1 repeat family protein [Helicobacter pullorum]|uniref:sel1 repeat family protein n=1 Tax=Helicobacter pullorum TaxID=35818 RepID=UPI0007613CFE|nr:sel1 repeat family protein [Helicobacter pullorum]
MKKSVFLILCLSGLAIAQQSNIYIYDGNAQSQAEAIWADWVDWFNYNKEACEAGKASACLSVGNAYETGVGAKRSYKKAQEYFRKAYEMGNEYACAAMD